MTKIIETNSLMDEILLSKSTRSISFDKKIKIKRELFCFFKNVRLFEQNGNKCFSCQNYFDSKFDKNGFPSSITDWEWDTNEIYLGTSAVGKQFKESIVFSLGVIESILRESFCGNSFYICVSIQNSGIKSINIRVYLNRGVPYVNTDLEDFAQPVLNEIFTV